MNKQFFDNFRRIISVHLWKNLVTNMPYYAVKKGRTPGIYLTWSECQDQVKDFRCAQFKKFDTEDEAKNFITDTVAATSSDKVSDRGKKRVQSKDGSSVDPESSSAKIQKISSTSDESSNDCMSVYTDGCCHANGRGNSRAGLGVYWGRPDHPDNLSERLPGRQTNNRAEIYAAIRAIQQAKEKECKELTIHTDSIFLINCHTKWMPKWKKNGWKASTGKPVINQEELEELDAAQQGITVKYIHVPGHDGVEGNEQADRLANEGAKKELKEPLE